MASVVPASRIQVSDLVEIFETELTPSQLGAFINSSHTLIQKNLLGKGLSNDELIEIHKYLAAHFASLMDQRKRSERVAEVSKTYQGDTGMYFEATHYGQMALALDTTGTLASLGQQPATMTSFVTPKHGSYPRP